MNPIPPLLGIYPKEYKSFYHKDICTGMLIAALFTTAKTWNQLKCPSVIDWIKKIWYIYTMEYYVTIKTEVMSSTGTVMELESIILSKNNAGTENQILHVLTCKWELNDGNTWAQRGEHHTLGSVGEWGAGEGQRVVGRLGRDNTGRHA